MSKGERMPALKFTQSQAFFDWKALIVERKKKIGLPGSKRPLIK